MRCRKRHIVTVGACRRRQSPHNNHNYAPETNPRQQLMPFCHRPTNLFVAGCLCTGAAHSTHGMYRLMCAVFVRRASPRRKVFTLSAASLQVCDVRALLSRTFTCHDTHAYSLVVSTSVLALLSLSVACHHTCSARGMLNAPCLNGTWLKRALHIVLLHLDIPGGWHFQHTLFISF